MPDLNLPSVVPINKNWGLVLRLALLFGAGIGLACAFWILGLHLTGQNAFGPKQLMTQLLVPLVALGSEWTLRNKLRPAKPGIGRSMGIGVLTVIIAALISAGSVLGLAANVGEAALERNRQEAREIVRMQQQEMPKAQQDEQRNQRQLAAVAELTPGRMAGANFTTVLLLGLIVALPAGVFFRE